MLKVDRTKGVRTPTDGNGAPGQDYLIARVHPESEDLTLDLIKILLA
jgi:hypothetical protein